MLTRRGFAGVAGCAICSLAGFSATEAFAQASAPTTANGVTRQILSRTDGPAAGYETIIMDVKLDKGAAVARHIHPGIESTYVMEGSIEVPIEGRGPRRTRRARRSKSRQKRCMLAENRRPRTSTL